MLVFADWLFNLPILVLLSHFVLIFNLGWNNLTKEKDRNGFVFLIVLNLKVLSLSCACRMCLKEQCVLTIAGLARVCL